MTTLTQDIIWTALPNGWAKPGKTLALSVFVAPRLSSSATPPLLAPFDFADWPATLAAQTGGSLNFAVTFAGHPPITAAQTSPTPSSEEWSLLFDPNKTGVDAFMFTDLSTAPLHSFSVTGVHDFISSFYTAVAKADPTTFPPAKLLLKYLPNRLNDNKGGPGWSNVTDAIAYHHLPTSVPPDAVFDPRKPPVVPVFDFHQTLSSLHSYPALMRMLGLVFDLEVAVPSGLSPTPNMKVSPLWTSKLLVTPVDVSPWTACRVTGSTFLAAPRGPDYGNGMLDLADTKRFGVVDLDTDGIADRLGALVTSMDQGTLSVDNTSNPTPALRTAGPSLIWIGWGEQPSKGPGLDLADLLETQKANNAMVEAYIKLKSGPLPVLHAEDLIRGHRIDVLTTTDPTPTWRSLCYRVGTYNIGPKAERRLVITDEGSVSRGVSRPHNLVKYNPKNKLNPFGASVPDPPDLYVHERLHRWKGWSAVAPRPGRSGVGPGVELQEGGTNPIPSAPPGSLTDPPQLSVTFTVPTTGDTLLPKLRLGELFRFRARGVDVAGNGIPPTSPDSSTATAAGAFLRYEPVESPHLAATAVPVPGESTQIMVILDYQTAAPVSPNGRWIFPPKISQVGAEEHGVLDGFVEGKPPNLNDPPSGAKATFDLLAKRDPARLNDVPGVKFYGANFDSSGNPGVGTPYFPGATKLSVPWLPDPLAAGACFVGIPGAKGPVTRFFEGGPWPDPAPLLLELAAGTTAGESFTPGTSGSSAVETITLPPGEVAEIFISSALLPGAVEPNGRLLGYYILAVWQWLAQSGLTAAELKVLEESAIAGLLWQLSPSRGLVLVHAVRIPLAPPTFVDPSTTRTLASTKAQLFDPKFALDINSTSSLDFLSNWTDPVDDITQPAPGVLSHSANAFKLTVEPGFVLDGAVIGATQDFGDTIHHDVNYTAVGTSRFNGYFRQTTSVTFSGTTPVVLSTLGLDAASVRLTIPGTTAVTFEPTDFDVDATAGSVALTAAGVTLAAGKAVEVSWIPTDTLAGAPSAVPVLSTARPVAPTVARVVPAWRLSDPKGSLSGSGILQTRQGNFLRVYVDRPWYSTGAGELLGVVSLTSTSLPDKPQQAWTTVIGADPIYDALFSDWGSFNGASSFTNLASVPAVQGHPAYSNPPRLTIPQDTSGALYDIWPYEVTFDSTSQLWFADVQMAFGDQSIVGPDGAYPPMFVRLALARFQPWSLAGVEVSHVVLATIAQPVPDRIVLVTKGSTPGTVQVQVEGWGYVGWRPAVYNTPGDPDSGVSHTQSQPETYGGPSIVVEVQQQNTSTGLSGDFAWEDSPSVRPVLLESPGDNGAYVSWSGEVPLPAPGGPVLPLRLCISEIDFYTEPSAPAEVDTNYRRPFVVHIPIP